ncbi:hypothetical protein CYMTET_15918, partial [Cymbomonas tetramitiformis]
MRGSLDTYCLPVTSCEYDNGGCDILTECSDDDAEQMCGECPEGYAGSGATGCVDEDGCQTGPGLHGCYTGTNGGCGPLVACVMDMQTDAVVCGACPSGLEPVTESSPSIVAGGFISQQRCVEVDGCASQPCWSSDNDARLAQTCKDVPAPGTGRTCGECPRGFRAEADGEGCIDIDECQEQPNGGCWISSEVAGLRTSCVNVPGAAYCTACPEVDGRRFLGTGETDCRPGVSCDVGNGNCDQLTDCSPDSVATTASQCGACPPGYSGTGDTACVDEDGCARDPCFPGVECVDIPAPGVGRTCQSCPEGYRGDGATCELCTLSIRMDPAMSTTVNGKMKRSQQNQLAAVFTGLDEPGCTLSQGVRYMWRGVTSDGVAADLDSDINKRETLLLYLPKGTLTTRVQYAMQLTATLNGNSKVTAAVDTHFSVIAQPLVVLIQGGAVRTGEGLPVELDASSSYDPDGVDGEMTFSWTCARISNGASNDTADNYCRDVTGRLLSQSNLIGPRLSLALQGSAEGAEYRLICLARKVLRTANASTILTIVLEELPVPTIVPLLHRKHDTGTKLTLTSQVTSAHPETLSLTWTVEPGDSATPEIANLTEAASTPLNSFDLVIHPNVLAEGSTYRFKLSAADSVGIAWISMDVTTNSPPHSGKFRVTPAEGFMYETEFLHEGSGWEDDPEDLLLWFQLRYAVVGASGGSAPVMLTQWQPSGTFQQLLASSGIEEHLNLVTVHLFVKDSLGAATSAAQNLTVKPLAIQNGAAQERYVEDALDGATQALMNGQDPCDAVLSMASLLNDAATASQNSSASESERRHRSLLFDEANHNRRKLSGGGGSILNTTREKEARLRASQAQRETMMSLSMEVWTSLLPKSTDTITRVAELMASVAQSPAELTAASRSDVLALGDSLVTSTRETHHALSRSPSSSTAPLLSTIAAQAIADGLSGAVYSVAGTSDQNVEVAAAVTVMHGIAFSAMQHMVPGEQPAMVASSAVSSVAQCDDMTSDAARLFNEPLESPSGVVVAFPRSLASALLEDPGTSSGVVYTALVSTMIDPHNTTTGSSSRREDGDEARASSRRISLLSSSGELTSGYMSSDVTSISLHNGTREEDALRVHGLEEAFTFSLAFRVPNNSVDEVGFQPLSDVLGADMQTAAMTGPMGAAWEDNANGNSAHTNSHITAHQCVFFFESTRGEYEAGGGYYSTEGCTTLPNPLPAGTSTYWREANVSMLEGLLEAAWGLTNTSLLANCREVWVDHEAAAQDALATGSASKRLRTYVGEGCGISEPGNEVGCWWDWWLQAFVGPGCVWTDQLGCMCTHLTDFAAAQSTRFGNRRFPTKVETLDSTDATGLSIAGIAESAVLLSVLSIFMLGAGLLFCVSNHFHNRERMQLLTTLVNPVGGTFRSLDDVWSWSLVDNVDDPHHRPGTSDSPTNTRQNDNSNMRHQDDEPAHAGGSGDGGGGSPATSAGTRSTRGRARRRQSLGDAVAQLAATVDAVAGISLLDDDADTHSQNGDSHIAKSMVSSSSHLPPQQQLQADADQYDRQTTDVSGNRDAVMVKSPTEQLGHVLAADNCACASDTLMDTPANAAGGGVVGGVGAAAAAGAAGGGGAGGGAGGAGGAAAVAAAAADDATSASTQLPGSAGAGKFQSDASYPLSEIASLRAQHSQVERPAESADTLTSMWTYKSEASIVGLIAGRYNRAMASSNHQESDSRDSITAAEQDQRRLGPSLKKSLWQSATTTLTLLARLRGGDGGSDDTRNDDRGSRKRIIRRNNPARMMTLRKPASQKRRNWNPFRAVGESNPPGDDASNEGRPSYLPFRTTVQKMSIFRKKIRVLNARALFKTMRINVFRLQLCIPLNYLEQLALDAMGSLDVSEAVVPGVGSETREVHSSPQAVTEGMAEVGIEPISHKGNAGSQQRQSGNVDAEKSLSSKWTLSAKRRSSSTKGQHNNFSWKYPSSWNKGDRFSSKNIGMSFKSINVLKPSISMNQFMRHQSSRKSISALVARQMQAECSDDEDAADADVGEHRGIDSLSNAGGKLSKMKSRSSDRQWQKRHLPVERMLGTAIVQAFLSMNAILSKEDVNKQTAQASQLPWQMPCDRPFSWYANTFKVLIDSIGTVGWYQRSHLWNLIFLQRSDGSYKMTIHLATVLKSGRPLEDLLINPVAPFDPVVLEESMPSQLLEALALDETLNNTSNSSAPTRHGSPGSSYTVAHDVWATLLVVQRLRTFPFTWIENPDDPTWSHITIQSKSEEYIARQCQEYPALQSCLPDLEDIAGEYMHKWTDDHETHIADMYTSQQLSQNEMETRTQSFRERFGRVIKPDKKATKRAKSVGTSFKRGAIRVVKAHPLTAIFLVTATEPFTRSDRILVQANTFICMLLFAVWFFYSKAVNCCRELRTHLTCPSSSDVNAPCLGFPTCAALVVGEHADGEPEELTMASGKFLCTAFPQSTYA